VAEFIIGGPLRNLAVRNPPLRRFLWRVDYVFLWVIQKIMQILPVDLSSRLGARIGGFIGPLMRQKSGIFRDNFSLAFPELNERELDELVKKAWGRAGRVLGEYPHLSSILQDPERIQIEIKAPIQTFSDTSRPLIVAAAHLSNWEVICSSLARMGIPNASLYSPPSNPLLDKMLLDSRAALNCELVPRDNSARTLMRALQRGRSLGTVVDRRIDEGHPIEFFGHKKMSTLMPAKLALKFNSPLTPVQVERLQDARYKVTFHPPIEPSDRQLSENEQAIDMTQQLHVHFEQWIRQKPEDWLCSKRMWEKKKSANIENIEEAGGDADIDSHAA
jgi:Kdo2-lipid IVA lauroyltransferase/acyltransferase